MQISCARFSLSLLLLFDPYLGAQCVSINISMIINIKT